MWCLPQELKDKHRDVMRELLMDVLRALSAPNLDIRKKTLDIALDLIDARNIDEVPAWPSPACLLACWAASWGQTCLLPWLLVALGKADAQQNACNSVPQSGLAPQR